LIDAVRCAEGRLHVGLALEIRVLFVVNVAIDFVEQQDQAFDRVGDLAPHAGREQHDLRRVGRHV